MAESSTATSKLSLLESAYRAPTFWAGAAAFFDLIGIFLAITPVGPGLLLCMGTNATVWGMRDATTGEYRRREHQFIWLSPAVFVLSLGIFAKRIEQTWGTLAAIGLLCQCLIATICCILTIRRLYALPVVYDKI